MKQRKGQIWLIGGTQESAELARMLVANRLGCTVTVTTEAARSLYPLDSALTVWVGRLSPEFLESFLQQQFCCILDASHPFAVEVSKLAIVAAQKLQIPYLRYERAGESAGQDWPTFDSIEALLAADVLQGRMLLTIGYRSLQLFQPWQDRATLFARILPSVTALEAALAAGFTPDRLIALRPPISAELEKTLWQQWQITTVVTKASGAPGGEDVKRQVAAALSVKFLVIERPAIDYPQQTSDFQDALDFCKTCLSR